MYILGDKVVPHSKSVGISWQSATEWNKALNNGQRFLYITKVEKTGDYWCAYDNNHEKSEYFLETDLKPYVEEKNEESSDSHDFMPVKYTELKVKDLIDLVNKGIVKEEDVIIVGRK